MHYAILYIDPNRRIKVFAEGGRNLEIRVPDIGWCLEADGTTWPDEVAAMLTLRDRLDVEAGKGRAITGPDEGDNPYNAIGSPII